MKTGITKLNQLQVVVALLAFALLVLLPLATLLCTIVWGIARRRRGPPVPSNLP